MSDAGADPGTDVVPTEETDNQEQSRRRIAFLLVAIAVALIVWWIISHIAFVPSTVGMSSSRSRSILKFAGFETSATLVPVEDKLAGRVVMQTPSKGLYLTWWPVRVAVGSTGLAGGPEQSVSFVIVPGTGALDLGVPAPAQEVMPTDPEEMLPLYNPPVTWDLLMPDVQNMTRSQAMSRLRRVGMYASTKAGPSTTDVAKGRVYYQKPAPGVEIKPGQTAVLWFSEGPLNVVSGPRVGFPYPRPPSQYGE